jgi:trehalose 6-phosphate phosphatase
MIFKLAMKGEMPLMEAVTRLEQDLADPRHFPAPVGRLAAERRGAEMAKRELLFAAKLGPGLEQRQEVLAALADCAIEVHAMDPSRWRRTAFPVDRARTALCAVHPPGEVEAELEQLARLHRYTPVNSAEVREAIVPAILEAGGYPLGYGNPRPGLPSPPTHAQLLSGAVSGEGGGVRNSELGRTGEVRPLWLEADSLRARVAEAEALYAFFSFDTALSQRASHGHLRTNPAVRGALIRLCAAPNTRGAVLSGRKVETLQRRLRLHRLAYVGVHGTDVQGTGLRMVTEPDLELAEKAVQKLRRACSCLPALQAPGIVLEDRNWSVALHLRLAEASARVTAAEEFGKLVAAQNLNLRRTDHTLEAVPEGAALWRAMLGLLAGMRGALPVYVGAGESDEEAFAILNRRNALTVHVGPPPRTGTNARWQVADTGEVIRLIHWLADARRRP